MADVLPNVYTPMGNMNDGVGMSLPQLWMSPPDEKDAYIGWLKGEFAAANAIIDSMCHHMGTIGGPGEYDIVFGCLNRRRHAWTPSLYMQQFFSVAEIVNSLQEVAWKKHQALRSSFVANAMPKACPLNHTQAEDGHNKKAQLEIHQASDMKKTPDSTAHLQAATARLHETLAYSTADRGQEVADQGQEVESKCSSPSSKEADGKTTSETGEFQESHSADLRSTGSNTAEGGDVVADTKKHVMNSTTSQLCKSTQEISVEWSREEPNLLDKKGFNAEELLNMRISIASKEEDARLATIKRSMQFHCCERVDGQMVNDGESAELCENVFSNQEINEIVEIICQLQAAGRQGELGCGFSTRKDSGCAAPDVMRFSHKQSNGDSIYEYQAIPKFLQAVIEWLTSCGILSRAKRPDWCLISIFDEGDFEQPNTDQGMWEKPLCVISLMGDCTMVFGHSISTDQQGSCKGPYQVELPVGSVLLIQENFTGILQKAIPASLSRRITIALGKAINKSVVESDNVNAPGKAKSKHWGAGVPNGHTSFVLHGNSKQARLVPTPGMIPLHPLPPMPHLIPQHPFPSIQPIFPNSGGFITTHPTMAPGWAGAPRAPKLHSTGTGVFLPSCDVSAGVSGPTWQSGLLVLSSFSQKGGSLLAPPNGLEVRRPAQSKKAEKYAGQARVKGSFESIDIKAPKKKLGKNLSTASPCQDIDGAETAANGTS